MRDRAGIVVGLAFAVVVAAPATAREVRYPAAHPVVRMLVPDDWSVAETPLGLELQSQEKDSLVLAAAVTSDKKNLDDWSKRALDRMRAAGISFAKDRIAARDSATRDSATTGSATKGSATTTAGGVAASDRWAEGSSGRRAYTFNGIPTVDSPVAAAEDKAGPALGPQSGEEELPSISTIDPHAATTSALHAIGHYAYRGGKLNGQPIDVELAVFPLEKKRFLMEQASGPTDARGVAIVRSLKAVPAEEK